MSGGRFDISGYQFRDLAEQLEFELEKMGKEVPKENRWHYEDWYEKYPEDRFYEDYPEEVKEKFRKAVRLLKEVGIYVHEIDYLLSGDTGTESFLQRLETDLNKI